MAQCHLARMGFASQRGQALVLGMLVLGVALIALLRYVHTGQVVAARSRQTHALDAAAYSGALVQTRALNMLAYMNRAQIGHQLAMAHLVTLGSWASLSGTQARQLATGNPPAYLISMLFGADHGAAYLAASRAAGFDSLARTQGDLASAYAEHDRLVQQVFTGVQEQVVRSLPEVRRQAMLAVLAHSYPEARLKDGQSGTDFVLHIYDDEWPDFLSKYAGSSLHSFVEENAALYQFLAPRDKTARNNWVVQAKCPSRRHELRRRGRTQMDAQGRWQSVDTESFHALRSNRWIGCYYREYSMGWGWIPTQASHVLNDEHVENPPDNFSSQDFWRWVREATNWNIASGSGNPLANSKAVANRQRWSGGGLPAYFDVRNRDTIQLGFKAALNYPGPEGLTITTRSAAESFFERPHIRTDGRSETANIFRPYWQARLSPAAFLSAQE